MTDDLVKRLLRIGERIAVPCPDGIKGCLVFHYRIDTDPTCKEAADRIEKLEAALREFATCDCSSNCDAKDGRVCELWACREALNAK